MLKLFLHHKLGAQWETWQWLLSVL